MQLTQSQEDYLETIFLLDERTKYVRSIDIANELGYTKPSISRAMSILKKDGYIDISNFKELYPLSRKYLVAYLDYLDNFSEIKKVGDKRVFLHK